jgi:hypothetical protein
MCARSYIIQFMRNFGENATPIHKCVLALCIPKGLDPSEAQSSLKQLKRYCSGAAHGLYLEAACKN